MADESTTTMWLGNLDSRVTRKMLYELGIQAGPVVAVNLPLMPDAPVTRAGGTPAEQPQRIRGYGFVEYESTESAAYAVKLFRGTLSMFGKHVRVDFGGQKAGSGGGGKSNSTGLHRTPSSGGREPQERRQYGGIAAGDDLLQADASQPPHYAGQQRMGAALAQPEVQTGDYLAASAGAQAQSWQGGTHRQDLYAAHTCLQQSTEAGPAAQQYSPIIHTSYPSLYPS